MLKKAASFVLASFRPSTGTRPPHHSAARTDVVLLIRRTVRPRGYASGPSLAAALLGTERVSARQGWAGEKSGPFEHSSARMSGTLGDIPIGPPVGRRRSSAFL